LFFLGKAGPLPIALTGAAFVGAFAGAFAGAFVGAFAGEAGT